MLVRSTSDRSPEESRKILLLMLLRAFWEKNFMQIERPAFHLAFGSLLKQVKDALEPHQVSDFEEMGFSFDKSQKRYPMLDALLEAYAKLGVFSLEWHEKFGDGNVIEFRADTGQKVRRALADDLSLTADENRFLMPVCTKAIAFYNGEMRRESCG
jgi:hypothetical protein